MMAGVSNLNVRRWYIAVAAIVMQLCLGTVYAWSVFKGPLKITHGWSETATQAAFMLHIFFLGTAAAFGGILVDKKGPRLVATLGGILFGLGTLLAGLADQISNLPLMWVGYGMIAGLGNGFAYVTPIATLTRWFPDKRGLVTGLAVMGFGAGAFFMGQIGPVMLAAFQTVDPAGVLVSSGVAKTFYIWGVVFFVAVTLGAQFFANPPKGWLPDGFTFAPNVISDAASLSFGQALKTPQWWMLWLILFLNIAAGLGLISQLSPIAQKLYSPLLEPGLTEKLATAKLAWAGGLVVAVTSIFNGLGRLGWARISDYVGRKQVFLVMFATQVVLYLLLGAGLVSNYWIFMLIGCYLLACYGGGFATMPAFAADSFGAANIGRIYGFMLTAWSVAGVVGPLIFAQIPDYALFVAAGLLAVGLVVTVSFRAPRIA